MLFRAATNTLLEILFDFLVFRSFHKFGFFVRLQTNQWRREKERKNNESKALCLRFHIDVGSGKYMYICGILVKSNVILSFIYVKWPHTNDKRMFNLLLVNANWKKKHQFTLIASVTYDEAALGSLDAEGKKKKINGNPTKANENVENKRDTSTFHLVWQ